MAGLLRRRRAPVAVGESPLGAGTVLAVSPHADDAALSLGASLAELPAVHVFTVFLGTPEGELSDRARRVHEKMGLPLDGSALAARRAEDLASAAVLGAHLHQGDFLDAIYRRRGDGTWLVQRSSDLVGASAPPEPELEAAVARRVAELVEETGADVVATCAAVGGHVDHRLVRAAVERLDVPVVLWEDLPYAAGRRAERLKLHRADLAPGPGGWARKADAVGAFASQLPMLWSDADWRAAIVAHARDRGGGEPVEVTWSRYPRAE